MLKSKKLKRGLEGSSNENESDIQKKNRFVENIDDSREIIDEEEKDLEAFLFGEDDLLLKENPPVDSESESDDEQGELLGFSISTKPAGINDDEEILSTKLVNSNERKAAWVDPDDSEISVDIKENKQLRKLKSSNAETKITGAVFQERLKSQFEKVIPAPSWADVDADDKHAGSEDEEDQIFNTASKLLTKAKQLQKGILKISRVNDLNHKQPSNSTITSVQFHPSAKIAFTSSLNKKLNVFQVDGSENRKLQTIYLSKFPIHHAQFMPSGDKIILASRRKFYYCYDLIGGKVVKIPEIKGREDKSLEKFVISPDGAIIAFLCSSGYINLVSSLTHQWISSLKMNGKVNSAAFSSDSSKLFTAGSDGEIYVWDVQSRRCQHRFVDDGSISTTSLTVSNDGKYLACGSNSGVVNIYDDKFLTQKYPSPCKSVMNLTTTIHGTTFNSTSEMLAYYSPQVRNAIKLVHFPSFTTFSNWPISRQTLGNVSSVSFSPLSGYLGIGNEQGKAMLFRLNHYPDS